MTDLAKDFRAQLAQRAEVRAPEIVTHAPVRRRHPQVGAASRRVAGLRDGVHSGADRGTLCISSQVGCALDCSFCSTAQQGFNRNLTTAEIVGQVWLAKRELGEFAAIADRALPASAASSRNVVLMGMGEPLANFRNVVPALRILLDDLGFDLSRRRVTLSTSGLVPQIYKLAEEINVALAVSLHAPGRRAAQRAGADQPQASDRGAAARPAGTTSTSRTAAASRSNT